jgi:hypothetical protein
MAHTIILSADQQRDLEAEVAAGHFSSIEAAVKIALDNLLPGNETDMDWARPLADEARANVTLGDEVLGQEALNLLDSRIRDLQSRK